MDLQPENYYASRCVDKIIDVNGAGNVPSHWDKSTTAANQCQLVSYVTKFSVYNAEDYKRCVCYFYSKNGHETDCPQEKPGTESDIICQGPCNVDWVTPPPPIDEDEDEDES